MFSLEWKEKEKSSLVLQSVLEVEERRLQVMLVTLHSQAYQLNLVSLQFFLECYDMCNAQLYRNLVLSTELRVRIATIKTFKANISSVSPSFTLTKG